jgi:hypothetical protein
MADAPRRFPPPWRADKVSGGYVVRDASGQALAYLYGRETEADARQAKVLTTTRHGGSPSTSRGCRSCSGRASPAEMREAPTTRLGWGDWGDGDRGLSSSNGML